MHKQQILKTEVQAFPNINYLLTLCDFETPNLVQLAWDGVSPLLGGKVIYYLLRNICYLLFIRFNLEILMCIMKPQEKAFKRLWQKLWLLENFGLWEEWAAF